jgi:hypothetical protein
VPHTSNEKQALAAAQKLYEALDACIGVCQTTSDEQRAASPLLAAFDDLAYPSFPSPCPEELAEAVEGFLKTYKPEG